MDESDIRQFLEAVKTGRLNTEEAIERLRHLPFRDLGFAKIDHHRSLRQGYPEVIFARGKTPKQVAAIVQEMLNNNASHNILVTRADEEVFRAVKRLVRSLRPRGNDGKGRKVEPKSAAAGKETARRGIQRVVPHHCHRAYARDFRARIDSRGHGRNQ